MRQISGIYRTNRNKTKKYAVSLPSCWEELAPGQFGTAIYMLQVTRRADPAWIKLSLLSLLFEKHFPILEGISNADRETLLNGMMDAEGNTLFEGLPDFFYNTEPPLKNYIPVLRVKDIELIPASTDLSNIGFGEWCFLDTYFGFYFRSAGDDLWLNRMIATVYRERDPLASDQDPNFSGDLRQAFNENLVAMHADRVKEVPKAAKMAVFQWIAIGLKKAKEARPHVFPPQPVDQDGKPVAQPIGKNENEGSWMDIYADLLGPKFGTSEQLKKTNAMFVLDYLNKEQKTAQAR